MVFGCGVVRCCMVSLDSLSARTQLLDGSIDIGNQ